jgi:hypothetical protein
LSIRVSSIPPTKNSPVDDASNANVAQTCGLIISILQEQYRSHLIAFSLARLLYGDSLATGAADAAEEGAEEGVDPLLVGHGS